jgi:hypothetical protein
MRTRLTTLVLCLFTSAFILAGRPARADAPEGERDVAAEARTYFDRADAFRERGEWREALREYRQSLALKKTRCAMASAAVCLRALGQYDEALEQYEELLRAFPVLPAAMAAKVTPAIAELRGLVGTLIVRGDALAGATLFVDDRRRGVLPIPPLRLSVGAHVVRVEKEGFEPIVASGVAVRPAQENIAPLEPRTKDGRVRVSEAHNRVLDVLVDGVVVGKTPWEGLVAAGNHAVRVHGFVRLDDDDAQGLVAGPLTPRDVTEMGSDPSNVTVRAYDVSAVSLTAKDLDTLLSITATPSDAAVAIDGKKVARGSWEGRLSLGAHTLEVTASGYAATTQDVRLERRKQPQLRIALSRAPRLGVWSTRRSVVVALAYGIGAAGITAGAITGVDALVTIGNVRSHCNVALSLCPTSQMGSASTATSLATASTATLVVGAAGLVAGTLLVFGYRPDDPRPRRDGAARPATVAWSARVGLGTVALAGAF